VAGLARKPRAVSIHAPARGATRQQRTPRLGHARFQSTRPHGARPKWVWISKHLEWFQSTRPHGARPEFARDIGKTLTFQSTRPHGARRPRCSGPGHRTGFNPRARTGRDPIVWPAQTHWKFQSTRPHGARPTAILRFSSSVQFQSTRPHGARRSPGKASSGARRFQSTRPHGARRLYNGTRFPFDLFQSTRPHGRDLPASVVSRRVEVSIHAPARGATRFLRQSEGLGGFQSTRPHGARRPEAVGTRHLGRFNPRARTGRDEGLGGHCGCSCSFNPRARTGRDPGWRHAGAHPPPVSIHAPARGATLDEGDARMTRIVSIHAPARGATWPGALW